MSLTKSLNITILLLAAVFVVATACNPSTTSVGVPEPFSGQLVPVAEPQATVFLSASRSILIRDDANEGGAVLTAQASEPSTFTWTIESGDLRLDACLGRPADCQPLPADGVDPNEGVESTLSILKVLNDPGPDPAPVIVRVRIGEGDNAVEDMVQLAVVRPAGELAVSISSTRARIAPNGEVVLTATVSGGAQFIADLGQVPSDCGVGLAANEQVPANDTPAYCITWSLDERGLEGGGAVTGSSLVLDSELGAGENGEVLSGATYTAPLDIGSVTFRVEATDRRGNRAAAAVAIAVNSDRELTVADATSDSIEVAPGRSVGVKAKGAGGEAPYNIQFELIGADQIGSLSRTQCLNRNEDVFCEIEYQAPANDTGAVQIRVTITDQVGATASQVIPLTVSPPEQLAVLVNPASAVLPNSTTDVRVDVSGGTPPYTVCYRFRTDPLGQLLTNADDCEPADSQTFLEGLTLCTCNVGDPASDGEETVTLTRGYEAPAFPGDVSIEVRVADNTGATASASASVNISPAAGGSGTGGTGPVDISASVVNPVLCEGEFTTINAVQISGTDPYTFFFTQESGPTCPPGSLIPGGSSATFTPCQAGSYQIKCRVQDGAGTEASTSVSVTVKDPNAPLPLGCDDGNVCTDHSCSLGVCSYTNNTAPCDDGNYCTQTDTCSGGACVGVDNPCVDPLHCDESSDACVECLNATHCDDGNVCTSDSCSATGVCEHVNNSNVCDDGNFCTAVDECNAGTCVGSGDPCTNPAFPVCDEAADTCVACTADAHCDDGNVCTDDSCNLATNTCEHVNNTASCDDGNFCTAVDTCSGGACVGGASTPCTNPSLPYCHEASDECRECLTAAHCNDSNVCTSDSCNSSGECEHVNNSNSCDDGLFCTPVDTCNNGICVGSGDSCPGPALPVCDELNDMCVGCLTDGQCDDGDVCTDDTCNLVTNACEYTNNTAPCDDGVFCTANDVCSGGVCVGSGDPCTNPLLPYCYEAGAECRACLVDGHCDDGNICTDNFCNGSGTCVAINNSNSCDDGLFCTATDVCSGGTCVGGASSPCTNPAFPVCDEGSDSCLACSGDPDCDDGNPCTDDTCNAGVCSNVNNSDPCDDGNYCTLTDTCSGGVCVGSGDPCTTPGAPLCNEALDSCVQCLTVADCADLECQDKSCIVGICHYENAANGTACDDGNFCNGADQCTGSGSCNLHDGDPCGGGTPYCDEVLDVCLECTLDSHCNDGIACTDDSCNAGVCDHVDNCVTGSCLGGVDPTICD